jgi:hypothetical protein
MTQICIVKGNRFVAAQTAAEHSVPFVVVRETRQNGANVETIGHVGDQFLPDLNKWFDEHPASMKQPDGACWSSALLLSRGTPTAADQVWKIEVA